MKKCAWCDKKAEVFQSPLHNPDEPRFCVEHFNDYTQQMHEAAQKILHKGMGETWCPRCEDWFNEKHKCFIQPDEGGTE